MSNNSSLPEMKFLLALAIKAGKEIIRLRELGVAIEIKADGTPVTIADQKAEKIILKGLETLSPEIPIIAEEEMAAGREPEIKDPNQRYYLVDALDGTKGFTKGGDNFSVNIALVENRTPILGVIFAPALGQLYYGDTYTNQAFKSEIRDFKIGLPQILKTRKCNKSNCTILASRSHSTPETDAFLDRFPNAEIMPQSSSLKFCRLAEGKADIYPRLGPTCEWDIAAGHAILSAAGGCVLDETGADFTYKKKNYLNGHFLALGDKSLNISLK